MYQMEDRIAILRGMRKEVATLRGIVFEAVRANGNTRVVDEEQSFAHDLLVVGNGVDNL